MFSDNINRLSNINNYLASKKDEGIEAFRRLAEALNQDQAKLAILAFTYDNIETLGKIDDEFKLYESFFGILSHDTIYDYLFYEYENGNKIEEFRSRILVEMSWKLIEIWIATCFDLAKTKSIYDIPYYFKHNYSSLWILNLDQFYQELEKSQFEDYYLTNKGFAIDLITFK